MKPAYLKPAHLKRAADVKGAADVKRAIDVLVAVTGLIALAPLFALIAVAVWLEDFRSPFYPAPRVARGGGGTFRMFKFRSMVAGASASGVNSTAAGDPRITRAGRWLRRAKLDELPQLINVLRGEMSLVGPRPQIPHEVELYTGEERGTLGVRPGMTDFASIVFADEGEILQGAADPDLLYHQIIRPWKSRLALLYVERASVRLDLQILALTAAALVGRARALEGVEAVLRKLDADPALRRVARRRERLIAYPAPGAREIVGEYRERISQAGDGAGA